MLNDKKEGYVAKDVEELLAKLGPEARARIEREVERIRKSPLFRLRRALLQTQQQIAEELSRKQRGGSKKP